MKKLSRDMAKVADVDETFAAVPGNREFMVRKTPVATFAPFIVKYKNASFYQDRLGTNIGKALKKREWRFLRTCRRGGILMRTLQTR